MKKFIRLCGIAACTLLLLTGCSSKYERDDEPGRVENITVAKMQEIGRASCRERVFRAV